jgi:hypothetical protein
MARGAYAGIGGDTIGYVQPQPVATGGVKSPFVGGSTGPTQLSVPTNVAAYDGGGGGGGGSAYTGGTTPPPAAPLSLHADTNQALDALIGRYTKQLDNLSSNSGEMMDIAAQKIRDAREGGRKELGQASLAAGRASDPNIAAYDAATEGAQAGAIAGTAAQREANLTNALQGGVGVMGAPANLALQEKQLQLGAYNAQNAATNNTFQQFMAMLNASRTSPIYTGAGASWGY